MTFEEEGLNKSEKESPTCSKDIFRTVSGLAIKNDWAIQALDIETAFLQGEHIDRDIFVFPHLKLMVQKDISGNSINAYMAYLMRHQNGFQELKLLSNLIRDVYRKLIRHYLYGMTIITKLKATFFIGKKEKLNFI